ncbi:MAG TPA: AAA family ATPase [Methanocella sp.]|uniref:nucleotide-binding protein n=1 Tax=Methanocella sp. TaxID=2052833 RepID=UPI002C7B721A|nr:AAA family ATPase [Methanocella sp.]HTY89636.1 AAA family ATPase [Methanocella sp.]
MRQIAIYGKGGIGKSTIASNLSAALNEMGYTVMQVGCDPKRDSTRILAGGRLIPAVLETYREQLRVGRDEYAISLDNIVFKSAGGIYCVEAGGPEPGIGCAGRGVLTALQILKDLKAFETYKIDVAIYDVLGDVVCGGFAMPIREGFAKEIYLVCSGGFMSIYAANNIARAVQRLSRRAEAGTGLAGIICNSNGDEALERSVIPEFARRLGAEFVQFVPRSPVIQACEFEGRAVVEHSPGSKEADIFRELARQVMENKTTVIPTPISDLTDLEQMYRQYIARK